jgi:DNA-binding response OmpR family regulator
MDVVLLVEESDAAGARLASWARDAGREVTSAANAAEARHLAVSGTATAVVFDSALTGDGFPAELRSQRPAVALLAWLPVFSSARAAQLLEHGADDVLHGAMPQRESVARLEAAVRRSRRPAAVGVELGELHVDAAHGEASWRGEPIRLTRRERQVLEVLADAGGRPVRREDIYRLVWGYAMARGDRTVDVNIRRLRRKLKAVASEELAVETQPGIGYRLELAPQPVTTL